MVLRLIKTPTSIGRKTVFIPAAAFRSSITLGAEFAQVELVAGVDFEFFAFDDTIEETIQTDISLPKSWDAGPVTAVVLWRADSAIENDVVWGIQAFATADGDPLQAAYGAEVEVLDTNNATENDDNSSPETAEITVANAGKDTDVHIKIARKAEDVTDDLVGDACFRGICLFFTTDAATDV